jgi:tetratricopeptide (TPR) repeat protein
LIADAFHGLGDMSASESHLVSAAASLGYPVPTSKARMGAALIRQIFVLIGHRLFPSRLARNGAPDPRRTAEAARVYDRLQQVNFYRGEGLSIFFCGVTSLNVAELAAPSAELATAYTNAHAVAGAVPARKLSEAYFERATQALKIRPDPVVESYLMTLTGVYRTGDGQWEEADRALTRAATLAEELGFRRRMEEALGGLGISSFFQGNFEDAVRFSTKQLESGKRGDPQTQCWGLLGRAQALLLSQQLPDAVADIEQAAAFLPALGRSEEIWSKGLSALCALYAGDLARASAHADTLADKIAEAPPIAHYCLIAYGAVSEVRLADFRKKRTRSAGLASDRACRAETAATRVFRVAKPRAWLRRGVYFWISGRRTKAVRMWKRALDEATSLGTPYEAMLAHQLLATSLGHPTGTDRSASHAQQAAQLAARLRLNLETRPAWWPW